MNMPERFLHEKYGELQRSKEVKSAVKRKEAKGGRAPNIPEARIKAYLDRFDEILNTEKQGKREYGVNLVKNAILDLAVPLRKAGPEDLPENFFDLDKKIAREQGHGDVEITDEMKEQIFESTVKDQEASLSLWLDYMSSKDAMYPTWLKYYAIRSISGLSEFDKEKHEFKKRSKFTRSVFPDLNREALAYVLDALEKQYGKEPKEKDINDPEFKKILKGANFAKLYAYAIEKVTPASAEQKETIKGEWIKYDQGQNHMSLVDSLQGHGTGWCTAGEATAKAQLEQGDFYVYYSNDEQSQPKIPRVAIRMQNDEIAEIRGINHEQNLEPALIDIAKEKAQTLPGHEQYEKKSSDMKRLTDIEKKTAKKEDLTKEELKFLYEMDNPIEGFGYQKDPRIEELRGQRDKEKDMPVIFECRPEQIAFNKEQVDQNTMAYIGKWTPEVLNILPENVKYIYESFPDKKAFLRTIETNPEIKNGKDTEFAMEKQGFKLSDYVKDEMLPKVEFSGKMREFQIVSFSPEQLGFPKGAKYQDIIDKAKELGLELCPAELGPQLRLQYKDQPEEEWLRVAMEPVIARGGFLIVFDLGRDRGELWLGSDRSHPGCVWFPGFRFLFVRPRKYLR